MNDAYLGAWNTIPPQNPNPLVSYVCRIVRNLAIKKYHSNTAAKRNSIYDVALDELENCFSSSTSVEGTDQDIDPKAYSDLADDRKDIMIEIKEGLRFAIWYYPSYGWINEPATMSYYRMTSDISEWFSKYVE